MEGRPGSGWRSEPNGLQASPKIPQTTEELQRRLQETLDLLSPQELRNFCVILEKMGVEPRVSQLRLELEGRSASGLARLLAKHYCPPAAKRVLVKVLQQLPRADLLPRWQNAAADGRGIPRKIPKRSYDCVEDELDYYDLSGKRKAFLMCEMRNRPGAEQDVLLMEEWLDQCQFEHTLCINPDKMELLEKITSFRDGLNEIKDDIGCCLVTLMSHGEEGFIRMKDGGKVSLEGIFEMFNNKNCPALQEKPKIFIIQACRGERRDSGVETDDEPMDSDDGSKKRRLPTFSDYFIIYPTQAEGNFWSAGIILFLDHVALRDPHTGSVMIRTMTDVFKQYGNKWHIADFFTKVNNRVVHQEFNLRREPVKVSLVMESTLTKFVYF
ncbi:caspase-14 isoform X1 [Camelus ferus]|uniref:Caspase-14 isoform X1 n=2 Tax=Camelus TaxID=9836 RepID=A0A8B8RCW0_CAMFR|nr:caspase-14-like isoform X1 [Camelus dromedarius]XP_032315070.1 caspase-14 isoform X1 [Camelus ferus]